jgi:hypothetical protein
MTTPVAGRSKSRGKPRDTSTGHARHIGMRTQAHRVPAPHAEQSVVPPWPAVRLAGVTLISCPVFHGWPVTGSGRETSRGLAPYVSSYQRTDSNGFQYDDIPSRLT